MVVEWPERLGARPSPAWAITLTYADPGDPLAGRVAMGLTVGTANGGKQTEGIQQESRQ